MERGTSDGVEVIRFVVWGLPGLIMVFVLYDLFRPLPVPEAVLHVRMSVAGKDDIHDASGAREKSILNGQIVINDLSSSHTLANFNTKPLFSGVTMMPDELEPHCAEWNRRFDELRRELHVYENECHDLSY